MPRRMYVAFVAVVLFSVVLLTACGEQAESPIETPQASQENASQEAAVSKDEVKKEAAEALEAAKAYTQQQKDVYQKKIEDRINELDNELNQLRARARASSAEAKTKLDAEIEELEEKGRTAREKLAGMREASDEKWEDLKLELDEVMTSLEEKLNELLPPME